ncbi:MAG: right-handed parallel beta-helix repeat-containing protein, partial [Planctomycetota bacterium]
GVSQFGCSVSVSGDYCLVGAEGDDDNGMFSGSAYIFKRDGTSWIEQPKLTASDGAASDFFGRSVSIDGDYCVIGAFGDDDKGNMGGSAYIFKRDGENWTQQAKLTASDGAAEDRFGLKVSISGEYCVIGAYGDDDRGDYSGSAYIFKRDGTSWTEQTKLTASDGAASDYFGARVSISGEYCVIGAYGDDDKGDSSGSAYIFKRDGPSWTQQIKLTASDGGAGDLFGNSVSINGDYCLVGALRDDDMGENSGAVYIYKRDGTSWTEQEKLTASDGSGLEEFGCSVSINGVYCVIGADKDDDNGLNSGSAYLFRRDGTSWTEQAKLLPSDGDDGDYFGNAVSIDGDYYVAGAYRDENMGWWMPGSAYVFSHELGGLVGLEITGPNEAPVNFTTKYKAIAHYDNGCTEDVTDFAEWLVEPEAIASIEAGLLRTEDINVPGDVNIYAEYTEGVLTFYAQMTVDIYLPEVLYVPADFSTIKAAVGAARNTDTVLVADGTYTGDGNREIDFGGKAITVQSENGPDNCIIDHGFIRGIGFQFHSGEDGNTVVDGFTVTNTYGGVSCKYSRPRIINCIITGNGKTFSGGGGMYFYRSSPTVSNCIISNNKSADAPPYFGRPAGAGIYSAYGSPVLTNCVISDNTAEGSEGIGGAVVSAASTLVVSNCTITSNWAGDTGGAFYCYGGSLTISNCIIRDNYSGDGNDIYLVPDFGTDILVEYSNVEGGWTGAGNMDADPCFVNPYNDDYHLLEGSPCIDAGDPNYVPERNETDLDGNPRVRGYAIDMGAYEYPLPLLAQIQIRPRTLNLRSKGRWIMCLIRLTQDYDVADIEPNSILLGDEIEAEGVWLGDEFAVAKFSRSEVQEMLGGVETPGEVELVVSGELSDGTIFEGTDTIRVIDVGGGKNTEPPGKALKQLNRNRKRIKRL